jgi:dTMP kinase
VSDRQQSLVMLERHIESYGKGIPYLAGTKVKGRLIVIEGPDASGRSTQITVITSKLEGEGHAVLNTGLRRTNKSRNT